ncbi:MAG: DUF6194 family protein [Planctomycetota bacterium]
MSIDPQTVIDFAEQHLDGVNTLTVWGERALFYNPGQRLKRGTYFATVKEKDGANDRASGLDRPEVWRLNIGISKAKFGDLFGPTPSRPAKGGVVAGDWDFTALDMLTPHPVYGWMGWVAVCCPQPMTWKRCQRLLEDAHRRAAETYRKRAK